MPCFPIQALQNNTKAIEDLAARVQSTFGNLMLVNVDDNSDAQSENPPMVVIESESNDVIQEFLNIS